MALVLCRRQDILELCPYKSLADGQCSEVSGSQGPRKSEAVGWHHRLNGREFEQALGDGEG